MPKTPDYFPHNFCLLCLHGFNTGAGKITFRKIKKNLKISNDCQKIKNSAKKARAQSIFGGRDKRQSDRFG